MSFSNIVVSMWSSCRVFLIHQPNSDYLCLLILFFKRCFYFLALFLLFNSVYVYFDLNMSLLSIFALNAYKLHKRIKFYSIYVLRLYSYLYFLFLIVASSKHYQDMIVFTHFNPCFNFYICVNEENRMEKCIKITCIR